MSAYARQFLDQMDRPDLDQVDGLPPAIAIPQRTSVSNPRSTVATLTEIHDHLRVLYARVGTPFSPHTGRPLRALTAAEMVGELMKKPRGTRIEVLAPVVRGTKGRHGKVFERLRRAGFHRLRIDGQPWRLDEEPELDPRRRHDVEVVVDRVVIKPSMRARLSESVDLALRLSDGLVLIHDLTDGTEALRSEHCSEPETGFSMPPLEPALFSFNSPFGACPVCSGVGTVQRFDPDLVVPDPSIRLRDGAVAPVKERLRDVLPIFEALAKRHRTRTDLPWDHLPEDMKTAVLHGTGNEALDVRFEGLHASHRVQKPYEGVIPQLERRFRESAAESARAALRQYARTRPCPDCQGTRLRLEARCVKVGTQRIDEVVAMSVQTALSWVERLDLDEEAKTIAERPLQELAGRLRFMSSVGLDYLNLDRAAATLSGGEAQRLRLATQLGRSLTGVLYVLDEPSIGLHARDTERLIATLRALRDLGNTVIVIEHDESTIRAADWVIDMGPGAGQAGGHVVGQGPPEHIEPSTSPTARYLTGMRSLDVPSSRRNPAGWLELHGPTGHNLKGGRFRFPLGVFIGVSGVSGSGKSTLVSQTLLRTLQARLHHSRTAVAPYKDLVGLEQLDKVIAIDQRAIGRTPRSNAATYTGLFDDVRALFAQLPEAKWRGFKPSRFSFNVRGGRCETCKGDGVVKVEMQLLPDVYVRCRSCSGRRYNEETLTIRYRGVTVADVLDMTTDDAFATFQSVPAMARKLGTLQRVGLGYLRLGQGANTLSGGEAQRLKLAKELARRETGRTLYVLDEPTTGLHFDDIRQLLRVLNELVDLGNTVLVIEHDLDVLKSVDWIMDLGPEGGAGGGRLVAEGPPETVARSEGHTGRHLRRALAHRAKSVAKMHLRAHSPVAGARESMTAAVLSDPSLDLFDAVEDLKQTLNAVVLAHYYQDADIQDVADFIGDSLQLAQAAAKTEADVIVFCGVHFMAETAKILNPDRLVLLPDLKAGCSLADGCPPDRFRAFLNQYPDHFVVSYVNCSAAVKAMSDVIVTSSNAKKIIDRIPADRPIVFAPDQHLGRYLIQQTGRDMVLWPGTCQVHELFSEKKLLQLKTRHPDAKVIAHPECEASVLALADHIGSTRSLLEYVESNDAPSFIVATEPGIIHQMEKRCLGHEKTFIPAPPDTSCACNECPHMKLNTLEKLYLAMRLRRPSLDLDPTLMERARTPIQRMLDWS